MLLSIPDRSFRSSSVILARDGQDCNLDKLLGLQAPANVNRPSYCIFRQLLERMKFELRASIADAGLPWRVLQSHLRPERG